MWLDSHCHLTADRYSEDRPEVIARAFESGVDQLIAIGSGGPFAQAAAMGLLDNEALGAREIVERGLEIAADICIYTNHNRTIEELNTGESGEQA